MSGQEFVTNLNLKGLQITNARIENVTSDPTENLGEGRIVIKDGAIQYRTGSDWKVLAKQADLETLSGTVGTHTTQIKALQDAIGTDESGNSLTTRVVDLEGTVGDSTKGLVKDVADHKSSISTNTNNITSLTSRMDAVETKATTNASAIGTLKDRVDTAESDIDKLEASVGTSSDTAKADGSVYARIAQNVSDISALKTAVGDSTSGLTKKVADLESGKVDKETGKGLSTNDYTTDEKNKLKDIAAGAQVNVLEKVLFQGSGASSATALTITDKGVTINLSDYALKSNLANAYIYKGSKKITTELPTEGLTAGDVYNIEEQFTYDGKVYPAGTNVAWNGTTQKWDPLGGTVDLSSYATKTYVDTEVGKKQDTLTDAQKDAVNSGITATKVSTYDGYATSISANATAIEGVKKTAEAAVVANAAITGATKCKVTYDSKGLVTGGSDLAASDIPSLPASKITDGVFAAERIPVALVTKSVTLTAGTAVEVASGLTAVYLAQVLDNAGAVVLCRTVIAGGKVSLTADIAATVTVNMVGLR